MEGGFGVLLFFFLMSYVLSLVFCRLRVFGEFFVELLCWFGFGASGLAGVDCVDEGCYAGSFGMRGCFFYGRCIGFGLVCAVFSFFVNFFR